MSKGLYSYTPRKTGDILTASQYNADHQLHIDNGVPQKAGSNSDNVQQMQIMTNPGAVGTESLASSMQGELERLRYAISRIVSNNNRKWYEKPYASLSKNRHALVYKSVAQIIPAGIVTKVTFDSELFDTDNIHDNITNNTRLTVPAGVDRIRIYGQLVLTGTALDITSIDVLKNDTSANYDGAPGISANIANSTVTETFPFSSAIINVSAGDYFELRINVPIAGLSIFNFSNRTIFGMEIIRGGS